MQINLPANGGAAFAWNPDATPPSIPLSTDASGPHTWAWTLTWNSFTDSDSADTPDNQWDASAAAANGGGLLTITAAANGDSASASFQITGANPTPDQLTQFLSTQPGGPAFAKILQHESGCRHFGHNGQPIVSFDHGYGMCQLTTPTPSFVQAWNWQSNVLGGLALFAQKQAIALAWLRQGGRTYTDDQLEYEAVSLWNGGHYHVWSGSAWERNPNILCDPATGNIGWNMTDPQNAGQSVQALHSRDAASFSHPPGPSGHWMYSGVCYADRILG